MTFCIGFLCSISQVKSHLCAACGGRRRMEWLYWQAGWETWGVWVAVHYLSVCNNSAFPSLMESWSATSHHPNQIPMLLISIRILATLTLQPVDFLQKDEVLKGTDPKLQPYWDFYSKVKLRSSFGLSISHKTKLQSALCKGNVPVEFDLARLGQWVMGRSFLVLQRETWAVFEYKIGIFMLLPCCLGNTWKFCCFLYMLLCP